MVESLRELNQKCQKPNYKIEGSWMERYVVRDAALPLTWLLLHTNISANQVTLGAMIFGLVGIAFLGAIGSGLFLISSLLLLLWYILDQTDGQIARYRGTSSLSGRFFDYLMHHLIHGSVFFGLSVYVYRVHDEPVYLIWGYIVAISITLFNCISDAKYKTFIERFASPGAIYKKREATESAKGNQSASKGFISIVFTLIHKFCEIHIVINTLIATSLLGILFKGFPDLRELLFFLYGITIPALVIVKAGYLIVRRKIDQEFEENYERL